MAQFRAAAEHEQIELHRSIVTLSGRSTSVQVIKWHRRASFVCLYDDVALYLPNDRHAEQTVEEEPLVVSEVCHHDLQKVVRLTGNKMEGYHLWIARTAATKSSAPSLACPSIFMLTNTVMPRPTRSRLSRAR